MDVGLGVEGVSLSAASGATGSDMLGGLILGTLMDGSGAVCHAGVRCGGVVGSSTWGVWFGCPASLL